MKNHLIPANRKMTRKHNKSGRSKSKRKHMAKKKVIEEQTAEEKAIPRSFVIRRGLDCTQRKRRQLLHRLCRFVDQAAGARSTTVDATVYCSASAGCAVIRSGNISVRESTAGTANQHCEGLHQRCWTIGCEEYPDAIVDGGWVSAANCVADVARIVTRRRFASLERTCA